MRPYLLVAGDFVPTGGMDMANLALAGYLAGQRAEVHLVTNRVAVDLAGRPSVTVHRVVEPAGSDLLSGPLLDRAGRRWAARIAARGGRVIVNGSNCRWGDVNWVHYLHAAWAPQPAGNVLRRLKIWSSHRVFLAGERGALAAARVVIANSERTRRDVVELLGIPADRVHTVYYGVDAGRFRPWTAEERRAARRALGWPAQGRTVAFIGAPADGRKGFDTLFSAWKALCADREWDVDLAVVGAGTDDTVWTARAATAGLESRIRFLGFRSDVDAVLAACDGLCSPARYEAYGLAVHEAICCGLPAIVSRTAGIAERYPPELQDLLLRDPGDVAGLVDRLRAWRGRERHYRGAVAALGEKLRARTWDDMAAQILEIAE